MRMSQTSAKPRLVSAEFGPWIPHSNPLTKTAQDREKYFALVLSQRQISLYEANREDVSLVATFNAEGTQYAGTIEPDLKERLPVPNPTGTVIPFHAFDKVARFIEMTEPLVREHLRHETCPLVLVGTPFMRRIYRELNAYPHLKESCAKGNGAIRDEPWVGQLYSVGQQKLSTVRIK